jgi:hypothetical protein
MWNIEFTTRPSTLALNPYRTVGTSLLILKRYEPYQVATVQQSTETASPRATWHASKVPQQVSGHFRGTQLTRTFNSLCHDSPDRCCTGAGTPPVYLALHSSTVTVSKSTVSNLTAMVMPYEVPGGARKTHKDTATTFCHGRR